MDKKKIQDEMNKKIVQAKKVVSQQTENAKKEVARIKKEIAKAGKKVEDFVKKNPGKAAAISAGIGIALGAGLTALLKAGGKKKNNRKK